MANLNTWFQKHDLCAGNILYIYRNDHKTVIWARNFHCLPPYTMFCPFYRRASS